MTLQSFLLILTGVLLNAVAQLALKASVRDHGAIELGGGALPAAVQVAGEPALWLGLLCYGVSVIVWILALSRVDVSIAYPMLSIGYIINALIARYWLGETMGLGGWLGIGFIVLGVTLIARQGA